MKDEIIDIEGVTIELYSGFRYRPSDDSFWISTSSDVPGFTAWISPIFCCEDEKLKPRFKNAMRKHKLESYYNLTNES